MSIIIANAMFKKLFGFGNNDVVSNNGDSSPPTNSAVDHKETAKMEGRNSLCKDDCIDVIEGGQIVEDSGKNQSDEMTGQLKRAYDKNTYIKYIPFIINNRAVNYWRNYWSKNVSFIPKNDE